MPRDIAPLTSVLEDATPGERSDVYSLFAARDQSIETALVRGSGSRFQEIMGQYLEEMIDPVDPDRLRHFDDSYRFDLERAAAEYGRANDDD